LLVDEFQDVNAVQYDLLKRLAEPHGNFFAVGDDEQSIFTWTGADPYVLVRFGRDYGIERPIVLDRNCRCSRQIFETARRVLAQNPQLFEKQLSAEQESPYEVAAWAFRDEAEEASWLLEDLRSDCAASRLGWGDYAILYRRHKIGEYVEGRLVRAGIPCRLARGRSLVEDDVIKYVIAALRIVRDPSDPVALEAFARCVLSPHFLQEVMAATSASSPADAFPEAVRLAQRLEQAMAGERGIAIASQGGLEIALRGMLVAAGLHRVRSSTSFIPSTTAPADDVEVVEDVAVVTGADAGPHGLALTLFKALQLLHARELDTALERYVTFDLETTDKDVEVCEVVEVGAVRGGGGEVT